MQQQSILSFFGSKSNKNGEQSTTSNKENTKKEKVTVVPVKNVKKERKRKVIESDSSNEELENIIKKSAKIESIIPKIEDIQPNEMSNIEMIKVSDYNPLKNKYNIESDACWRKNEKVPYMALARTFAEIEGVSARLQKIEAFANYLRSVIFLSPFDLISSIYLCLNRVAPEYAGIELNVGESFVIKALSQATGTGIENIKNKNKSVGDLGQIAYEINNNQTFLRKPQPLTVDSVFKKYQEISEISGKSAQSLKVNKVKDVLLAAKNVERKYIVRGLLGKLGIQFAEQSVLAALGNSVTLTPPNSQDSVDKTAVLSETAKESSVKNCAIIKRAFCECPNYDLLISKMLIHGVVNLPQFLSVKPGVPIKPMLAQPSKGISEVMKRFDESEFTCEYKYDGERAQIHLWTNEETNQLEVRIFSRNQEDNTQKYPDVISMVKDVFKDSKIESCIIDSEAVAWDREQQTIRPFQELATRKRKDVKEEDIKIQVCIYAFDLIYFNGQSLVEKNLRDRRAVLFDNFPKQDGRFTFATSLDSCVVEEIQEFLEQSIKDKCEGLMVKSLDSNASYEISKRSRQWLKLKKDYMDTIGDSVDLVVIGAYYGNGKRANKYGAFLMACYDTSSETYQAICKLGTGFKDDDLDTFFSSLNELIIKKPNVQVQYSEKNKPDVFIEPKLVWEVKAADLSISPDYMAAIGLVDSDKGISLRFPRYLRVREDKQAEQATNSKQISQLYCNQDNVQGTLKNDEFEDEFY